MSAERRPSIIARFVLDAKGMPQWDKDGDGYWIRLSLRDAPPDTYAVTYQLHESYYDPIREVSHKRKEFSEDITSYGDYTVIARVRRKSRTDAVSRLLSRALSDGHLRDLTRPVEQAIGELTKR